MRSRIVLLVAITLGACRSGDTPAARDTTSDVTKTSTLTAVNDSLRALQLPLAQSGEMTRDSVWRVYVASDSATSLYIVHGLEALVLPDGPIEVLAPVTYFRFDGSVWRQATQKTNGVIVPPGVERVLSTEFTDRERTYFYRVRVIDLAATGANSWPLRLRAEVEQTVRDIAQWRKAGFISADAEP